MSDTMWNDPPYKFGDWKNYAVHNDKEIKGFFGPKYRFLSNFWRCSVPIEYNGLVFFYTENAFMAAKSLDVNEQKLFINLKPSEAKQLGREIELRKDWEIVKYDFMFYFNLQKFDRNPELKQRLLDTGDKYLEELNAWGDTCWGVDTVKGGENNLGKILMRVRSLLKK
jgi:ribA/ribD-fused uncharacterized protein